MSRSFRVHDRGRPPHPDILTPAEREVLSHLRRGLGNAEIAVERGTTLDAVKYHLANIRLKLAITERDELIEWARSRRMRAKDPMVIVYVADIERAVDFYTGLGLDLAVREPNGFTVLSCGEMRLGLHGWRGYRGPYARTGRTPGETLAEEGDRQADWMPSMTLNLSVPDVEAACRTVLAHGGIVIRGVVKKPWAAMAEVADPDGNAFELVGAAQP